MRCARSDRFMPMYRCICLLAYPVTPITSQEMIDPPTYRHVRRIVQGKFRGTVSAGSCVIYTSYPSLASASWCQVRNPRAVSGQSRGLSGDKRAAQFRRFPARTADDGDSVLGQRVHTLLFRQSLDISRRHTYPSCSAHACTPSTCPTPSPSR